MPFNLHTATRLGVVAGLATATVLPILMAALGASLMLAPHLAAKISLVAGLVADTLDDVSHLKVWSCASAHGISKFTWDLDSEFSYGLQSDSEF